MLAIRLAAGALAGLMSIGAANAQDQGILGVWWTKGNKGRVEIADCAAPKSGLCGTIIWISQPNDKQGKPQTDRVNPKANLRSRPVVGLQIFEGWREAGKNKWRGSIYDPDNGQTHNIGITLAGERVTLTGCVMGFCESETWKRYKGE